MKTSTSILVLATFLLIMVFTSCSSSEPTAEKRLELIGKSELNKLTTVYKYKFNFENDAWMDVTAYVKKDKSIFIISINGPAENNINNYTFNPELERNNLSITNRVKPENAGSLEDAIRKSILFYLADNI